MSRPGLIGRRSSFSERDTFRCATCHMVNEFVCHLKPFLFVTCVAPLRMLWCPSRSCVGRVRCACTHELLDQPLPQFVRWRAGALATLVAAHLRRECAEELEGHQSPLGEDHNAEPKSWALVEHAGSSWVCIFAALRGSLFVQHQCTQCGTEHLRQNVRSQCRRQNTLALR